MREKVEKKTVYVAGEKGRIKGKRLRRAYGTLEPPIFSCSMVGKAA